VPIDLKQFGDRAPTPDGRKVASSPASKTAPQALQLDRYFRVGKAPDAAATSALRNSMNYAMLHRTKAAFEWTSILGAASGIGQSSAGAGLRARFRFAFHTSPYQHALYVRTFLYPQTAGFNSNAYAQLDIYSNATETVNVSSTKFYYGNNPLNTLNVAGWQYMKDVALFVDGLSADTDYYAKVSDGDNGLIQSISAADLQSMTENYNGYLASNYTQESLILSTDRSTLLAPMPLLWKRGGAKVLNWTVDTQASPQTTTSATATNLIDNTSTTYGSSIPGYTLDMTGKARLSQPTGVPCKMFAYIDSTSANVGLLELRDSAGTIIQSVNYTGAANTPAWYAVTFNLPASSAKYYLTFRTSLGTFKVYAVSIIEYET
jgi:hypothetical protein